MTTPDSFRRLAPGLAGRAPRILPESLHAGAAEAELVTQFADALAHGRYCLADGDQYLAAVERIDGVNWPQVARWRHVLPAAAC